MTESARKPAQDGRGATNVAESHPCNPSTGSGAHSGSQGIPGVDEREVSAFLRTIGKTPGPHLDELHRALARRASAHRTTWLCARRVIRRLNARLAELESAATDALAILEGTCFWGPDDWGRIECALRAALNDEET